MKGGLVIGAVAAVKVAFVLVILGAGAAVVAASAAGIAVLLTGLSARHG